MGSAAERGYGKVAGVRWEQTDRTAEQTERSGGLAGLRDAAVIAMANDALRLSLRYSFRGGVM